MKILVVDDEQPIVEAVAYSLKKEGYTVQIATDAEQCLEFAYWSPGRLLKNDCRYLPPFAYPAKIESSNLATCHIWRFRGEVEEL